MPLVATPMSATANSYVTEAEADAYFAFRLNGEEWGEIVDRASALITATSWLEMRRYVGGKTTTTQALKWPRSSVYDEDSVLYDDEVIPSQIKRATFELALWLGQNPDSLSTSGLAGFKSIQLDQGTQFDLAETHAQFAHLPPLVMRIIADFLLGDQVRVLRA